jgi:hypothetical protein
MQDGNEIYSEGLERKNPITPKIENPTGLAREKVDVLRMKTAEVVMYTDNKIEISFLEKASYYIQITWKLIKIIYPIMPYLITIWQWIESLKSNKRSN